MLEKKAGGKSIGKQINTNYGLCIKMEMLRNTLDKYEIQVCFNQTLWLKFKGLT